MTDKNTFLCYDIGPDVTAFSTTRHGGVSQGSHATFNVNAYCGDAPEDVRRNRTLLCQHIGIDESRLVMPHQAHGVEHRLIAEEFFSLGTDVRQKLLEGVDALLTQVRGTCIGVSTADCIPIILYDAERHAGAVVHAGWRGTLCRIVQRVAAEMAVAFGSQPAQLRAVVGPGISLDAFEVGQEVYDAFAEAGHDMNRIARMYEKWHIDLPECNRQQLLQAGLTEANIHATGICTHENYHDFFSARRLGTCSGRILTGIVLR